ncbi:hypothetical protein DRI96_03445 [Candidatus Aerophobetes bacterium]|uniref:Uncharacterized protein n=1 Tax=Aerophobetes bacterium TaxID=2030807 RepID=A0A662DCF1_UNCAE|nr:MAG: hypothetical protein DRI96_03445 [Candidatus Aerophobetes bacterium]
MIQKVKNPGDILFSILNTTYEFLGEKGGEEMIKEWCEYVAENGLWSGVVDATKSGGIKGLKNSGMILLKLNRCQKELLKPLL